MYGEFTIVGCTGSKEFRGKDGSMQRYARVTLRDETDQISECKADPDVDFKSFLDKKATVSFRLLKDGVVRAIGVE